MWLAALEDNEGMWNEEPLPTDGTKEQAIDNAKAMWPTVPDGWRIALYRCTYMQDVK